MTIKPVDMQVLVPRAGEVERINRTVQGQQQTDQQIMSQLIQEDLKQKEQIVNHMQAVEKKKIEKEEKEKNKENKKREKGQSVSSGSEETEQQKEKEQSKHNPNKGRYLDLKI